MPGYTTRHAQFTIFNLKCQAFTPKTLILPKPPAFAQPLPHCQHSEAISKPFSPVARDRKIKNTYVLKPPSTPAVPVRAATVMARL